MLKRLRKLALLLPCFLFLAAGVQADEIHLKDGRIIHANKAWEQEGEIQFKLQEQGRLFRVQKGLVKEVKRTGKAPGYRGTS